MARYNFERFSNNLARTQRFNNYREPIEEAYFPKMDSLVASRAWPSRPANTTVKDLNRELDQVKFDVRDLESWTTRFVDACHQGFVITVWYLRNHVIFYNKFLLFLKIDKCSKYNVDRHPENVVS